MTGRKTITGAVVVLSLWLSALAQSATAQEQLEMNLSCEVKEVFLGEPFNV